MNRTAPVKKQTQKNKAATNPTKRQFTTRKSTKPTRSHFKPLQLAPKSIPIRHLSTTPEQQQSSLQDAPNPTSPQQQTLPDAADATRTQFKAIVATMNDDQRKVIQALVGESTSLRTSLLKVHEVATQRGIEIAELQGKVAGKVPQADPAAELPSAPIDFDSPTLLEDLIARETNPRVKQSLMREKELRSTIQPLVDIVERAASEKQLWLKQQKKLFVIILALSGIVIGQGISFWTSSPESIPLVIANANNLQNHLNEAIDVIEMYQNAAEQPNPKRAIQLPNARWSVLKEKIRLDSLPQEH